VKLFKLIIGWILILSVGAYYIYTIVTNPDMTNMRLLMTFWAEYLVGIALLVIGTLLTVLGSKK